MMEVERQVPTKGKHQEVREKILAKIEGCMHGTYSAALRWEAGTKPGASDQ